MSDSNLISRGVILSCVLVVVGLIAVWVSFEGVSDGPLRNVIQNVAAVLITSGLLSWWSAYLAREQNNAVWRAALQRRDSLVDAGIVSVTKWKLDIPREAKSIDMLLIRGHTFFSNQATSLREVLANSRSRVRICITRPASVWVAPLASKFDETPQVTHGKIVDTLKLVAKEAKLAKEQGKKSRVELRVHDLMPAYTYYRFDDKVYATWYTMKAGRMDVPCIQLEDGYLASFFKEDFEHCWESAAANTVWDSDIDLKQNEQALAKFSTEAPSGSSG